MTEEIKQEQVDETTETVVEAGAAEQVSEAAEVEQASDSKAAEPTSEAEQEQQPAEPTESMEDYQDELEASFKDIQEGDIIKGTVIGVSDEDATLDLKFYTEGIIPVDEFSSDPTFSIKENVSIGDEIEATVIKKDDGQGHMLLSKKKATDILAWEKFQNYMDNETNLTVKVQGVVNAGVIAYLEGIRGFIPASKLSLSYVEDLEEWLHKELEVRVITVDKEKKRLVLSAREILREKADEERKNKISNVEVGLVTTGVVETIKPYGAFINLGDGLSGLVHISQICEKRIKTPAVVLTVGDEVKVKVIAVKEGKISLSMKALEDVAAREIQEEKVDIPKSEGISTNLGDLIAKLTFK